MKKFNRILRISLYMLGIFLTLASCAKEQTYGDEPDPTPEPDSKPFNHEVSICRIGNDVMRLSVTTQESEGKIFLSSTTEFSSTAYQTVSSYTSWSPNSNGEKKLMYPFYISNIEKNQRYYYYVIEGDTKIASGSFILKDTADILTVTRMAPQAHGLELNLSVPVWFLNIISYSKLYINNGETSNSFNSSYGTIDRVTHNIDYKCVSNYDIKGKTEYPFRLLFGVEGTRSISTTVGSGVFTTL